MNLLTSKTTKAELLLKQKWPLSKKIEHSLMRIKEFVFNQGGEHKVYVAFSGGKDSTVLLHLVRSLYSSVEVVFVNTTNEFPEIIKFVKSFDNVIWLKPKKTYKQIVREEGFPLVSKKTATMINRLRNPSPRNESSRRLYLTGLNRKGQYSARWLLPKKWYPLFDKHENSFNLTSKCCDVLKKNPIGIYERRTGKKAFIGTMAANSDQREQNYIQHGCNVYTKGKEKSRPLSIWTDKDIWDYIDLYKLDYADIYKDKLVPLKDGTKQVLKGEQNTGCMWCGFGVHLEDKTQPNRFDRLKLRRPKLYQNYMKLKNGGVEFREALDVVLSL